MDRVVRIAGPWVTLAAETFRLFFPLSPCPSSATSSAPLSPPLARLAFMVQQLHFDDVIINGISCFTVTFTSSKCFRRTAVE